MGTKKTKVVPAVTVTAGERRVLEIRAGQTPGEIDEDILTARRRSRVVDLRQDADDPQSGEEK